MFEDSCVNYSVVLLYGQWSFLYFLFSGICGCREEETDGCRASDDRPLIQVSVHRDPFRKHSLHFLCIHDICIGMVSSEVSILALFPAFVGFQ